MLPENEEAWELWEACAGQWRYAGLGSAAGLDYTAVKIVADALDIRLDRLTLYKIKALESAVMIDLSKRNPKGDSKTPDERVVEYCGICIQAKRNKNCPECSANVKVIDDRPKS